jgi:NADPH:quinone reductase-like Zn-dependent oxidoreductase
MRAIQFTEFGDPSKLRLVTLPDPRRDEATAVIRIKAASVNPSDVKNVAGQMEHAALPRAPGRDFSGVVEEGPNEWIGAEVWGTGGDIGFLVDGTHAERIAFPVAALMRKPGNLDHAAASAVGVNFVVDFYHNEGRIFGADSRKLDIAGSARLLAGLVPGFESGAYAAPVIAARYPLEDARAAYEAVARGTEGRVVIIP